MLTYAWHRLAAVRTSCGCAMGLGCLLLWRSTAGGRGRGALQWRRAVVEEAIPVDVRVTAGRLV